MCGICGVFSRNGPAVASRVEAMASRLAHRGPDGARVHATGPVALGHRRLSIIDLSEASAQPISNEDGALWLVFNGEVYNYRELRADLRDRHRFRSQGDAEVILHLYEEQGSEALKALEGMFALALWDTRRQELLLARDRAGKKPLYYYDGREAFAFASETKALLALPDLPRELDAAAVPLFLTYGYVPTPGTLYKHVRSLPPGHSLVVRSAATVSPVAYWTPSFGSEPRIPEAEAAGALRERLRAAVHRRLVSDVPLGAHLSGGLDSSSVVAFMAEAGPVRTFSMGFAGPRGYDERAFARAVAEQFATQHTEFVVEPRALDLIDRLVWHHDGPFGDSSALPTYLLAELTRGHVKVALSGDGGDDVLAGYLRFYGGVLSERLPGPARPFLAKLGRWLPRSPDRRHRLDFVRRFLSALELPLAERLLRWAAVWPGTLAEALRPELRAAAEPALLAASYVAAMPARGTLLDRLLQVNFRTYLLDDLLVKADRMSMAHGLEVRSPFLDTDVIDLGSRLPDRLRMRRGAGKVLLREAMTGILPDRILRRPKAGFGVPLSAWFRDDLRAVLRERLGPESPIYAYLEPAAVSRLLGLHETTDVSAPLWTLLTLDSWLRQQPSWR